MAEDKVLIEGESAEETKARFSKVTAEILSTDHMRYGIGTYKEKTLHLILKKFFEPDEAFHEIRSGSFVADIKNRQGITEIQSAGFSAVKKRWFFFSESGPLTVVYPIPAVKYVAWINPESGEISEKHKSPKKGNALHILPELLGVETLVSNPNVRFKCVLMELTEYRTQDGWGREGKRGSHRFDLIPEELFDIVEISSLSDISDLIPFDDEFTSAEFGKVCGFPHKARRAVSASLGFLVNVDIIRRIGKRGKAYLYKKTSLIDEE